jgi:hypothetical protein
MLPAWQKEVGPLCVPLAPRTPVFWIRPDLSCPKVTISEWNRSTQKQ